MINSVENASHGKCLSTCVYKEEKIQTNRGGLDMWKKWSMGLGDWASRPSSVQYVKILFGSPNGVAMWQSPL